MDYLSYFAADYTSAREKFLEAASSAGAALATFDNPAPSPDGTPLCTDVAVVGDPSASATLLVNTATHGVEGLAGSAALVGWLRSGAYRYSPPSVKMVLVHALNPYAFAWTRRVDENNVDVNRNFIDHGERYPENRVYERLHSMLVPPDPSEETLGKCASALLMYAETEGIQSMHSAVSRGQFTQPDGLCFGGHRPSWSNRTFCAILAEFVSGTENLAFVDIHTGPGPYGHGKLICSDRTSPPTLDRASRWYGPTLGLGTAGQVSEGAISGSAANAVRNIVLGATVTSVTLKFGASDSARAFDALRADNWTHLHVDLQSRKARSLKADLLENYCPQDENWRERVWIQSRQVLERAVRALAQEP